MSALAPNVVACIGLADPQKARKSLLSVRAMLRSGKLPIARLDAAHRKQQAAK